MKKTNQKGFTLIELLIVIGIIAILAAAVIIAINPGRQFEQAREATRWSHVNSVANAVYSYAIDNGGNFPDCITAGETDISGCSSYLVDTYMAALPTDPQATSGNGYNISTDGTRITIASAASESEVTITQ
ncbi:MAG: prepilin-type N-terminal cleavage/methylation domain-containing protein [Patescibacteria group bacterium]|nr:prepilin-type N-terminal cleavage/methylation domain-containing protein [Patescibacteria group bacterium]